MEILTAKATFGSGNGFGNEFNGFVAIAHPLAGAQLGALAALDDPVNHHPAGLDLGVGKTTRMAQAGSLEQLVELDELTTDCERNRHKTLSERQRG